MYGWQAIATCFRRSKAPGMSRSKEEVRGFIGEIGIIPALRVSSPEEAIYAAETVADGGIPIVEVTMTVPGALEVIATLARKRPDIIAGAGTVLDTETAKRCAGAGAMFLTSTGLELEILKVAAKENLVVIPGALTPTEIITAWKAGADFVKVFPCAQVGGPSYIRAMKAPLPHVRMIASGGVTQLTASTFMLAGAEALGIGSELMPREAIRQHQAPWIHELARRFLGMVKEARKHLAER
jgi:2-dehydro-3-deoxyphosphogluconate aldolase / (4S)-4-hydroxy-2-oxoglutarate aldolase